MGYLNICILLLLVPVLVSALAQDSIAPRNDQCTTMIVGRKAGKHGPMTTHTADCLDCDFRVNKVPAADHAPGSMRNVYLFKGDYPQTLVADRGATWQVSNLEGTDEQKAAWGTQSEILMTIPEVEHTYALFEGQYGIMNEWQLAMGESTCAARFWSAPVSAGGKARIEVKELSKIALERCKTARCAIEMMGDMAVKYGMYAADWSGGDMSKGEGGEALTVIDKEEAWVFHILSDDTGASAVWAAQRVPEDHIAVVANSFVIREIDPKLRGKDFLYSDNIFEVAQRNKLWKPSDGRLDFLPTYAPMRAHAIYSTRRVWRVFDLAAPSLKLPAKTNAYADDYPFSVPVDRPLDEDDLMRWNGDHYEGTEFDLTKGVAAGPYGDPARFDVAPVDGMSMAEALQGSYQRPIGMFRTTYSFVATARELKTNLLARLWFGQYQPSTSSYMPVYIAADLPGQFTRGSLMQYDATVPFWNYLAANNYASRFYKYAMVDVFALRDSLHSMITKASDDFEQMVNHLVETQTQDGRRLDGTAEGGGAAVDGLVKNALDVVMSAAVLAAMNDLVTNNAAKVVQAWKDILPALITKYHDGYIESVVDSNLHMERLFYPKWWLTASGYFKEPPESGKDVIMFDASPIPAAGSAAGMSAGATLFFVLSLTCGSVYLGYMWGVKSSAHGDVQTPSDESVSRSAQKPWFKVPSIQMNTVSSTSARGYAPIDAA